jgi:hypothetical protein
VRKIRFSRIDPLDGDEKNIHQKRPRALIMRYWRNFQAVLPNTQYQQSQCPMTETFVKQVEAAFLRRVNRGIT